MLNSQFWEIRKRQGLLFTILSNWLSFLRNLVNFIIRKIALCATHFQGGQTKFPENVNVACKGHVSGNKKPQRAIENEFNMQKLVKLTHFLFFVINLSLRAIYWILILNTSEIKKNLERNPRWLIAIELKKNWKKVEKRIGKKKNRKRNENRIEKREIKVQIEKEQKSPNKKREIKV